MDTFRAFRIFQDNGAISSRVVQTTLDDLSAGDVVIRAAYSSVNYKDALAATGTGRILRRFPLVGGIDVSGTVVSSSDPRFSPGAAVLVTGYELGVSHDGGYAERVRVPADWVVALPPGLGLFEVMAIGTAGFTAGLSMVEMERNGLTPRRGPVIVTGATGGVGSIGVALLAARGYEVTAVTGKDAEHEYLKRLGAREVLARSSLSMGTKPLEKALWAGAIDPVGGETLAWLTRTMRPAGVIASSGLAGGSELHTTVMPFILRGVKLLGIDSVSCPMDERRGVWRLLADCLTPECLRSIATEIALAELPAAFERLLGGGVRGRLVVKIS